VAVDGGGRECEHSVGTELPGYGRDRETG
jgi:hypothetical protein